MACVEPAQIDHRAAAGKLRGSLLKRINRQAKLFGQQQRVLLARALCATRSLLLLDEPVAGLDPLVTRELYEIIHTLHHQQDRTVVMISHDISAALTYADRVLHISNGSCFLGTPEEYRLSALGRSFAGGEQVYA